SLSYGSSAQVTACSRALPGACYETSTRLAVQKDGDRASMQGKAERQQFGRPIQSSPRVSRRCQGGSKSSRTRSLRERDRRKTAMERKSAGSGRRQKSEAPLPRALPLRRVREGVQGEESPSAH